MTVGEAVVVVVGTADEVGRMATAGELVDWVVDVGEDEWEGEPVTVEVVEVVAVEVEVEVEVDVRGRMGVVLGVVLGVVEGLDVEGVEELVGDLVTVGWTVEITVVPTTPLQVEISILHDLGAANSQLTAYINANTTWDAASTAQAVGTSQIFLGTTRHFVAADLSRPTAAHIPQSRVRCDLAN